MLVIHEGQDIRGSRKTNRQGGFVSRSRLFVKSWGLRISFCGLRNCAAIELGQRSVSAVGYFFNWGSTKVFSTKPTIGTPRFAEVATGALSVASMVNFVAPCPQSTDAL
jgi:hypothetical protein